MRIGVLRGGVSPEYDISIKTGGKILSALQNTDATPIDMLITKDGTLHVNGVPFDIERIPEIADAVFIALHGELGEDGKVQKVLEDLNVPFNGTRNTTIADTLDKRKTKEHASRLGFDTIPSYTIPDAKLIPESMRPSYAEKAARKIWENLAPPWVIKPTQMGSSKYVRFASTFPELVEVIFELLSVANDVLAETYIPGREVQLLVAQDFRNQDTYVSPPLEIFHGKKILGETERAEGNYGSGFFRDANPALGRKIEDMAKTLFSEFGLEGYATMDFLITPRKIYILEIDALPALDENAPLSRILENIGSPTLYLIQKTIK